MYQVPLRFVKISPDVAIMATRIVAIMSTSSFQARETVKREKRAGTLINGAGREAVKSAIFLDNGSVISSPYSVNKIMNAVAKANAKETDPKGVNNTQRIKVVDTVFELEPEESSEPEEDEGEEDEV